MLSGKSFLTALNAIVPNNIILLEKKFEVILKLNIVKWLREQKHKFLLFIILVEVALIIP